MQHEYKGKYISNYKVMQLRLLYIEFSQVYNDVFTQKIIS